MSAARVSVIQISGITCKICQRVLRVKETTLFSTQNQDTRCVQNNHKYINHCRTKEH